MRDGRDQVSLILCPGDLDVYVHTKKALLSLSYDVSLLEEEKSWDTSSQNYAKMCWSGKQDST